MLFAGTLITILLTLWNVSTQSVCEIPQDGTFFPSAIQLLFEIPPVRDFLLSFTPTSEDKGYCIVERLAEFLKLLQKGENGLCNAGKSNSFYRHVVPLKGPKTLQDFFDFFFASLLKYEKGAVVADFFTNANKDVKKVGLAVSNAKCRSKLESALAENNFDKHSIFQIFYVEETTRIPHEFEVNSEIFDFVAVIGKDRKKDNFQLTATRSFNFNCEVKIKIPDSVSYAHNVLFLYVKRQRLWSLWNFSSVFLQEDYEEVSEKIDSAMLLLDEPERDFSRKNFESYFDIAKKFKNYEFGAFLFQQLSLILNNSKDISNLKDFLNEEAQDLPVNLTLFPTQNFYNQCLFEYFHVLDFGSTMFHELYGKKVSKVALVFYVLRMNRLEKQPKFMEVISSIDVKDTDDPVILSLIYKGHLLIPIPDFKSSFSVKNFALFAGDEIIGGRKVGNLKLEGSSFSHTSSFVSSLLVAYKAAEKPFFTTSEFDCLLKRFSFVSAMSDFTYRDFISTKNDENLRKKISFVLYETIIKTLHENDDKIAVFPFGYSNATDGHAMLIEFEAVDSKLLNFKIFNTGDGVEYHASMYENGRRKILVYLEYRNVPLNVYLNSSLHYNFLGFLMRSPLPEMKGSLIYEAFLFEFLHYKWIPDEKTLSSSPLMVPQFSGTCAMKIMLAYCLRSMERFEFNRFITFSYSKMLNEIALAPYNYCDPFVIKLYRYVIRRMARKLLDQLTLRNDLHILTTSLEAFIKDGKLLPEILLTSSSKLEKENKKLLKQIQKSQKVLKKIIYYGEVSEIIEAHRSHRSRPNHNNENDLMGPSGKGSLGVNPRFKNSIKKVPFNLDLCHDYLFDFSQLEVENVPDIIATRGNEECIIPDFSVNFESLNDSWFELFENTLKLADYCDRLAASKQSLPVLFEVIYFYVLKLNFTGFCTFSAAQSPDSLWSLLEALDRISNVFVESSVVKGYHSNRSEFCLKKLGFLMTELIIQWQKKTNSKMAFEENSHFMKTPIKLRINAFENFKLMNEFDNFREELRKKNIYLSLLFIRVADDKEIYFESCDSLKLLIEKLPANEKERLEKQVNALMKEDATLKKEQLQLSYLIREYNLSDWNYFIHAALRISMADIGCYTSGLDMQSGKLEFKSIDCFDRIPFTFDFRKFTPENEFLLSYEKTPSHEQYHSTFVKNSDFSIGIENTSSMISFYHLNPQFYLKDQNCFYFYQFLAHNGWNVLNSLPDLFLSHAVNLAANASLQLFMEFDSIMMPFTFGESIRKYFYAELTRIKILEFASKSEELDLVLHSLKKKLSNAPLGSYIRFCLVQLSILASNLKAKDCNIEDMKEFLELNDEFNYLQSMYRTYQLHAIDDCLQVSGNFVLSNRKLISEMQFEGSSLNFPFLKLEDESFKPLFGSSSVQSLPEASPSWATGHVKSLSTIFSDFNTASLEFIDADQKNIITGTFGLRNLVFNIRIQDKKINVYYEENDEIWELMENTFISYLPAILRTFKDDCVFWISRKNRKIRLSRNGHPLNVEASLAVDSENGKTKIEFNGKLYDLQECDSVPSNWLPKNNFTMLKMGDDFLMMFLQNRIGTDFLSFSLRRLEGQNVEFYCNQHPNKVLSLEDSLDPEATLSEYILIQDSSTRKLSIFTPIKDSRNYGIESTLKGLSFEEIRLSEEGSFKGLSLRPQPSNNFQKLLLAHHYLCDEKYSLSLYFLKSVLQKGFFQNCELQMLGWIAAQHSITADFLPEAAAIRYFILFMLQKNLSLFTVSNPPFENSEVKIELDCPVEKWKSFWTQTSVILEVGTKKYNHNELSSLIMGEYFQKHRYLSSSFSFHFTGAENKHSNIKLYEEVKLLNKIYDSTGMNAAFARLKSLAGEVRYFDRYPPDFTSISLVLDDNFNLLLSPIRLSTRKSIGEDPGIWDLSWVSLPNTNLLVSGFERNPHHKMLSSFYQRLIPFIFLTSLCNYAEMMKLFCEIGLFEMLFGKKLTTCSVLEFSPEQHLQKVEKNAFKFFMAELNEEMRKRSTQKPFETLDSEKISKLMRAPSYYDVPVASFDATKDQLLEWKNSYFQVSKKRVAPMEIDNSFEMSVELNEMFVGDISDSMPKNLKEFSLESQDEWKHGIFLSETKSELKTDGNIDKMIENLTFFVKSSAVKADETLALMDEAINNCFNSKTNIGILMEASYEPKNNLVHDFVHCYVSNEKSCYEKLIGKGLKCNLRIFESLTSTYLQHLSHYKGIQKVLTQYEGMSDEEQRKRLLYKELKRFSTLRNLPRRSFQIFEGYYGLSLYPQQLHDLELFTRKNTDGTPLSFVLQRPMSYGKTFTLGTLMAVSEMTPGYVVCVIPPASLFETNAADLLFRAQQTFGKTGYIFKFERSSFSSSAENLLNIRNNLMTTLRDQSFIVAPPESLQALENRFVEFLLDDEASIRHGESITLMNEILLFFRSKVIALFDEVDVIFSPNNETNFPLKDYVSADFFINQMIAKIYYLSFVKGIDLTRNMQKLLVLEERVKFLTSVIGKVVVEHIIKDFHLSNAFDVKPKSSVEEFVNFLQGSSIHPPCGEKESSMERWFILRNLLQKWIPAWWGDVGNENFGKSMLRPQSSLAIPYFSASSPNEKAEFAEKYETIAKTIHIHMIVGLSTFEIKEIYERLQHDSQRSEILDSINAVFGKEFFKYFNEILCEKYAKQTVDILSSDDAELKLNLLEIINFYLTRIVFTGVKFYGTQVTNNMLNVAYGFNAIRGYSGTHENIQVLPHSVVHPGNVFLDKGANGRFMYQIFAKSVVRTLKELVGLNELGLMMSDVIGSDNREQIRSIIDVGAFLKDFSNKNIALAILNTMKEYIKVVLYYDEQTNGLCFVSLDEKEGKAIAETDTWTIQRETKCAISEIFVFFDQRHTTGSDIALMDGAIGGILLGPKTTMRDLLQAAMRMRKLLSTQKVNILVPYSLISYINSIINQNAGSEMTIQSVFRFLRNQSFDQKMNQNKRVAFLKIKAACRNQVLSKILVEESIDAKSGLLIRFKDIFIRSLETGLSHWQIERQLQDSRQVLDRVVQSQLSSISSLGENNVAQELAEIVLCSSATLPDLLEAGIANDLDGVSVENVQEQEQLNEDFVEVKKIVNNTEQLKTPNSKYYQVEDMNAKFSNWKIPDTNQHYFFPINEVVKKMFPNIPFEFSDAILVSHDFIHVSYDSFMSGTFDLFSEISKNPACILIERYEKEVKFILVAVEEFNMVMNFRKPLNNALITIAGEIILPFEDADFDLQKEGSMEMMQISFLLGSPTLLSLWKNGLHDWLESFSHEKKDLFELRCLKKHFLQTYANSEIKIIFESCCSGKKEQSAKALTKSLITNAEISFKSFQLAEKMFLEQNNSHFMEAMEGLKKFLGFPLLEMRMKDLISKSLDSPFFLDDKGLFDFIDFTISITGSDQNLIKKWIKWYVSSFPDASIEQIGKILSAVPPFVLPSVYFPLLDFALVKSPSSSSISLPIRRPEKDISGIVLLDVLRAVKELFKDFPLACDYFLKPFAEFALLNYSRIHEEVNIVIFFAIENESYFPLTRRTIKDLIKDILNDQRFALEGNVIQRLFNKKEMEVIYAILSDNLKKGNRSMIKRTYNLLKSLQSKVYEESK